MSDRFGGPRSVALVLVVVLAGCAGSVPMPDDGTLGESGGNAAGEGGAGSSEIPDPVSGPGGESDGPVSGGRVLDARVTRVIDGDTIEVRLSNGTEDTVRLLGVDTPETTYSDVEPKPYGLPETTAARDHLFEWGKRASGFARERLSGADVQIVIDPESDVRGYYGRLLGYIRVDGEDFNEELLARGLARMYDSTFSKRETYRAIADRAASRDIGAWGFPSDGEGTSGADGGTEEAETARETGADGTEASAGEPSGTAKSTAGEPDRDRDCSEFDSREAAQEFFESRDPEADPHGLDGDGNGIACESLPDGGTASGQSPEGLATTASA